MRKTVGRKAVDDPERVAELVVEAWADDANRQGMTDALANVIPDVRNFSGGRATLQIDEDRGGAGTRKAPQVVELRCFLQLALEPFGDLPDRVFDRGPGPGRLNHHGLDDEGRILVAPEAEVGDQPG